MLDTLQNIPPDAFERLCQRLLRESGFIEVEVTGKSGDGGIDGHGIIRLAGLISFPVLFQCKRYSGSVGASVVRDFRGAMVGRAEKGLILTTGRFTIEAQREATRDGATPIDLIDGELLMDKMKELKLGVSAKMVEVVEVDDLARTGSRRFSKAHAWNSISVSASAGEVFARLFEVTGTRRSERSFP